MGANEKSGTSNIMDSECVAVFFASLTPDEQTLFNATQLASELVREIQDADEKHKDSSTARKITSALKPFIAGIEQYGKAMDVFANSNDLLCPVWGGVRILLHLSYEFGEYFEKLSEMLEEMGSLLTHLPRYPRLYDDNEKLQQPLVVIYKSIFDFCIRARHVFRVGKSRCHGLKSFKNAVSFASSLRLLWKPFSVQFGDIKDRIAKSITAFEREIDILEREAATVARAKSDVQSAKTEHSQRLLAEFIDSASMAKVNEWLSPVNVASNHKAATGLRHAGTGTWFLKGDAFQNWLTNDNTFLWLYAIPGAGKTVLASSIINYLRDNVQSKTAGLAYFYCDYKDAQKQEPSKVLGTILATLAKQNKLVFEEIQTFFLKQYNETSTFTAEFDELLGNFDSFIGSHFDSVIIVIDALDEAGQEGWGCLAHAFKSLHKSCKRLKILVTSRNELEIFRAFEDLPSTSIEQSDVAPDIDAFITSELTDKIAQRKLKLRDPELEATIRQSLVKGAQGMFQWARCQIDALCKLRNDKAIRLALSNLPKTLQDTYVRVLQRVEDDHRDDVETVQRILSWLVRGVRHLTLDELAEAIAIDPESGDDLMDFNAVDNDPEDILELLGGLVTVSTEKVISLAHYSVKEFLVSESLRKTKPDFWIGREDVEAQLASVCLTYLCYDDFSQPAGSGDTALQKRLEEYKLLPYAAQAWALHAHKSERDGHQREDVVDLTMRLFSPSTDRRRKFESWVEVYQHHKYNRQLAARKCRPLFCAAFFGLTEATKQLLDEGHDTRLAEPFKAAAAAGHAGVVRVFLERLKEDAYERRAENTRDASDSSGASDTSDTKEDSGASGTGDGSSDHGQTPNTIDAPNLGHALYAAAAKGHASVVELLLDQGVDINVRGGKDGTALQAAALEGRYDVVLLFLRRGANHGIPCKRYGTPLSAAAEKGHQRTVAVLLEHGANPNARGGWHSSPLVSAILGRNMNIVRELIDRGADLNALGGRHGCPLMAAASLGMDDLVGELVDLGARVNDNDDKGSDALYAACLAGNLSTVNLLLELGADVNAKGGKHRNALGSASSEGHVEIVKCLLEAGADVEFFDEHYGNALQIAAQRGHDSVVRVLAEARVDPNAEGGDKGTALVCAASFGQDRVINVLFELGVPSGPTEEMTCALVAATFGGHEQTIRLLVDNGADLDGIVPSQTHTYCTSLEAAASDGDVDIVKLLLELGADANNVNEGWHGSALIAAIDSDSRSMEAIQALLDAGADVDQTVAGEHCWGFPLVHAVEENDVECVELLLSRGADVNLQYGIADTSIQNAAKHEDGILLDLLVEHGVDVNLVIEAQDLESCIGNEDGILDPAITALQSAAFYGRENNVTRLLALGADQSVSVPDAPFASALQAAAYAGHVDVVERLIEAGSDVNEQGGYFGTALQAASCRGHLSCVQVLLDAGACANETNVGYFGSALVSSCHEHGVLNLDVTRLLFQHGADVKAKAGGDLPYPLHAASRWWSIDTDLPQLLIELGADVNARGGKYGTALQGAASIGNEDFVDLLLSHGADPNITGGYYWTPLAGAYRSGWYLVLRSLYRHGACPSLLGGKFHGAMGSAVGGIGEDGEFSGSCHTLINQLLVRHHFDVNLQYGYYGNTLQHMVVHYDVRDDSFWDALKAGADVNRVGGHFGTALNAAAFMDWMEPLEELLERGADVNLGNGRYANAIFAAVHGSHFRMLKRALDASANVQAVSEVFGSTSAAAARWAGLRFLRLLVRKGAPINTDDYGKYGSPLQAAAASGSAQKVRFLLGCGAHAGATGGHFGSVLHAAALHCDAETVELLLRKGANVNERGAIYATPLQAAAARGSLGVALLLVRHGANVNARGGRYGTALQAACVSGNLSLVKLLLERGADPNLAGGKYKTALQAAAMGGHEEIAQLLLSSGAEWALVDRKLNNRQVDAFNEADELLERVLHPEAESEDSDEEDDGSEEAVDSETEDRFAPLLNVESIPGFAKPYRPPSRWDAVRSRLHLIREGVFDVMQGLESTVVFDAEEVASGCAAGPRANTFGGSLSSLSRSGGLKPKSKSLPVGSMEEKSQERGWDDSWEALGWVQVE